MPSSITDRLKQGIVSGWWIPAVLGKMPAEEREWAIDYERPQSATEAYHYMRP